MRMMVLCGVLVLGCAGLLGPGAFPELAPLVEADVRSDCADGNSAACDAIAEAGDAASTEAEHLALYDLYLQACPAGSTRSCDRLGQNHVYGTLPDPTPEQSYEALATACRGFDGGACYYAGSILAEGRLGEKDEPRAFEMFRTGCAQEHPLCCSWVGLMYQHGRGVEADPDLAFTLFKKGCALGEENVGCFNEAYILTGLPEAQQDRARILALFQRSCDAGNALSCENLEILQQP